MNKNIAKSIRAKLLNHAKKNNRLFKVHTMIVMGELNSRIKDYFDVWFLSRQFEFDGHKLLEAVTRTFTNRNVDNALLDSSIIFTASFKDDQAKNTQWQSFISNNELDIAPTLFSEAMKDIDAFIFPVVDAIKTGEGFAKRWDRIAWV